MCNRPKREQALPSTPEESVDGSGGQGAGLDDMVVTDAMRERFAGFLKQISEKEEEPVPDFADVIGCSECARPLTDTERHYYSNRCESCEGAWFESIESWRLGEREDKELDDLYSAPPPNPTKH